jgi:aldehyde dehydrogenase (NAD+)
VISAFNFSLAGTDLREVEQFLSVIGSDCDIANVDIGPSGAEIGGVSGERRRPAVAARVARTCGRPICAARPIPSITAARCRSRRA